MSKTRARYFSATNLLVALLFVFLLSFLLLVVNRRRRLCRFRDVEETFERPRLRRTVPGGKIQRCSFERKRYRRRSGPADDSPRRRRRMCSLFRFLLILLLVFFLFAKASPPHADVWFAVPFDAFLAGLRRRVKVKLGLPELFFVIN